MWVCGVVSGKVWLEAWSIAGDGLAWVSISRNVVAESLGLFAVLFPLEARHMLASRSTSRVGL